LALLLRALNSLLGGGVRAQVLKNRIRLFLRMRLQTNPTHQVGERLRRLTVPGNCTGASGSDSRRQRWANDVLRVLLALHAACPSRVTAAESLC
jgi:hypothetical protein